MVRALVAGLISVLFLWSMVVCSSGHNSWIAHAQANSTTAIGDIPVKRTGYVGDHACLKCHKEQSISYDKTSHHLTSQQPGESSILGSFKDGENVLMIANPETSDTDPRLYFQMDANNGGYYETAVAERGEQKLTRRERIDIVIGSGVRGQTYLYWAGDKLYELPVSYWSEGKQWINSPGYKDGTANFARHVDQRCLECHATYIRPLSSDLQTNIY